MTGRIKIGKKCIYSEYKIMQLYCNGDGTGVLVIADKNSNDRIDFNLDEKEIQFINKITTPKPTTPVPC